MPRRTEIKGVIAGFLSSFSSRYSDYDGYWIFGLLDDNFDKLTVDLLTPHSSEKNSVVDILQHNAFNLFWSQVEKSRMPASFIQAAKLYISRSNKTKHCDINGHWKLCFEYLLRVIVKTDLGREFQHENVICVAPHDRAVETRSTRRLASIESELST